MKICDGLEINAGEFLVIRCLKVLNQRLNCVVRNVIALGHVLLYNIVYPVSHVAADVYDG